MRRLEAFSEEWEKKSVVISQRRKESRVEGWKCEGWLDRSPTGNQEKAGDKYWGVLALLLSHSLLSLSSSLSPCIVK